MLRICCGVRTESNASVNELPERVSAEVLSKIDRRGDDERFEHIDRGDTGEFRGITRDDEGTQAFTESA